MRFDKSIWSRSKLSERTGLGWLCGACRIGQLKPGKGEITFDREIFSSILKCSNPSCKKEYAAVGKLSYDDGLSRHEYEVSKEYVGPKHRVIHPFFFYPTLHLFEIPLKCPLPVRKEIESAFQHFWSDSYSTLNSIRRSLEPLMDDFGVAQFDILHQRIEGFANIQPLHKDAIMALKHLGNAGSHNEEVTKEDTLDAFEILCHTLYKLYPDNYDEELDKRVQEIINKKGPRSKK